MVPSALDDHTNKKGSGGSAGGGSDFNGSASSDRTGTPMSDDDLDALSDGTPRDTGALMDSHRQLEMELSNMGDAKQVWCMPV